MEVNAGMGKVSFDLPVGYMRTGSGRLVKKSIVLIYDPSKGEWSHLSASEVGWEKISGTKAFGTGTFNVDEGSIIKHICKTRGETEVTIYYADPEKGLVEVPFKEEFKPVEEIGNVKLYRKYTIVSLPDGREVEIGEDVYKVGSLQRLFFDKKEAVETAKKYENSLKAPLKYVPNITGEHIRYLASDKPRIRSNAYSMYIYIEPQAEKLLKFVFREVKIFIKEPRTDATWQVLDKLRKLSKYIKTSRSEVNIPEFIRMKKSEELAGILKKWMENYELYEKEEKIRQILKDPVIEAITRVVAEYMGLEPEQVEFIDYMGKSLKVKTAFLGRDKFKEIVSKKGITYDFGFFYVDLSDETEIGKRITSEVEKVFKEKIYPRLDEVLSLVESVSPQ